MKKGASLRRPPLLAESEVLDEEHNGCGYNHNCGGGCHYGSL